MEYLCGIDIGGTFTDCALIDANGSVIVAKTPSTPPHFENGFFEVLDCAAQAVGLSTTDLLRSIRLLCHGTTVATNAVVEMRGSRVGLLTTKGHRDTLAIMRTFGRVAGLPVESLIHFASTRKPPPIVPKDLIVEVDERIDCKGQIVVPLRPESARAAVRELLSRGVDAVAIATLWSFLNPAHERALAEAVAEQAPGLFVTCSSDLVPKWGEYERTAATALNCFVGPETAAYVRSIESRLEKMGYQGRFLIMQCGGGVAGAAEASRAPLLTVQSGPVGGVVGSKFLGAITGERSLIATDMGGTSFDVSLITEGELQMRPSSILNQYQYFVPTVDIQSIGAGGGSIVWIDETGGRLRVGPLSAGSSPGPVCYGKGGTQPTVTDADLVLGYLDPEYFLGGKIRLHADLAREALERVGRPLGLSVHEVARGVARIVDAQMADLIRKVTVQRGHDPRDFVVLAYGGAGPTHASGYARELGAKAVVVPLGDIAAAWSALGVASADLLHVVDRTEIMSAPFGVQRLNEVRRDLEQQARALLESEGISSQATVLEISAELKYRAQLHELEVLLAPGEIGPGDVERLIDDFERKYETQYGKGAGFRGAGIEMVTMRCRGIGRTRKPAVQKAEAESAPVPDSARRGVRDVYWYELEEPLQTQIYHGPELRAGHTLGGPAIVEMPETTIVVRPGQSARVDAWGNFVIELRGDRS